MAEFIDILAQVKLDIQGDDRLKGVGTALDKAVTEATQLEARIEGLKDAIKQTDSQAKKGILQNELKKANAEMARLKGTTVATNKEFTKIQATAKTTGSAFSSIGSLAAGAFASFSILQLGQEVINATSQFQKFEAVLTNLTGSNDEAKRLIATFSQFAAETPFQVEEVVGAYVKLRNTGITPNIEAMRKLGDVASASGKDLNQLVEALIDAQVGENERLKEFGIRAQKVGEITKFTFRGVTTEVKNTSEAINEYITGLGDVAGVQGSNAAIAATLGGQISNLKDQFTQLAVNIGTAVNPILKDMIGLLSDIARGWSIVFKQLGDFRNNAADAVSVVGGTPVSAQERGQFNFVREFLKDIDTAINYGGKGTLARVRGLQFDINKAFEEGIITQQVLFALSAKLREAEIEAEKIVYAKKEQSQKEGAKVDTKAADKRKEAIKDITQDLQDAIADQQQKLQETQIKGQEESLETIRQQAKLEKEEALRGIDDKQRAISEKLKGKIPKDILDLLNSLRTGVGRQFDLQLEQDIKVFKAKQEQAIIEFETQRIKDRAKREAEYIDWIAELRAGLLTEFTDVQDVIAQTTEISENEALTRLQEIYNSGAITKEEFEKQKTEITKRETTARLKLIIAELNAEKQALEFLDDPAFKKRIAEINLILSQLNLQVAELGAPTTTEDKQQQLFTTIKTGYNEALSIIQQVNAAIVANETAKINALIALQQKRVDEVNRIADEGNAEALEREQNRLETLMQQREEAAQRQQRLSLILQASNFALAASEAILAVTKAGAFGGPAAPVTIGLVGAALAAGIGFILSLVNSSKGSVQAFAEGTPYVTGSDGVDRVPAMLSKGERVVTVDDNQRYSPIYDYLSQHQPDPKRLIAAMASPYPNYGGLQRTYEINRQFEKEQLLSRALLEKMTFVNGNLEILVTETVKNRNSGKVKITNVNDIAKAVNNDNMRWKI